MLKALAEYIVGLSTPETVEVDGYEYSARQLHRIVPPDISPLTVHTLSAIAEYVNTMPDQDSGDVSDDLLIHVENHDKVVLYDSLSFEKNRPPILVSVINDFSPRFGHFHDLESFNIIMQSRFVQNEDSAKILAMVGNLADENVKTVGDDGVSQQVTVKTGIQVRENIIVPNPVNLIPFRTFTEAEQPASKFVFRLRKGMEPEAALFEADGGAWKNEAIQNIVAYLEVAIAEDRRGHVTILA